MCVPRIGSFPSALNTWSKVWPWILIWAYLIWNYAPILGQQISILDPPTLDFLVRLGLNFHPIGEFWGSIGPSTFFCHGQKRDYLSHASQRARGATKNRYRSVEMAPGDRDSPGSQSWSRTWSPCWGGFVEQVRFESEVTKESELWMVRAENQQTKRVWRYLVDLPRDWRVACCHLASYFELYTGHNRQTDRHQTDALCLSPHSTTLHPREDVGVGDGGTRPPLPLHTRPAY